MNPNEQQQETIDRAEYERLRAILAVVLPGIPLAETKGPT